MTRRVLRLYLAAIPVLWWPMAVEQFEQPKALLLLATAAVVVIAWGD